LKISSVPATSWSRLAPLPLALFGFESGAALATVVRVLIEVLVMLSVVKVVNKGGA
jgi:ACR3 family arsenite efflux pump ArsB